MSGGSFKGEYELEKRRGESARIREKYPDRIPLIVEKAEGSDIKDIHMKRYLVPADLTASQLVCVIRKSIKLNAEEPIFIFVDNVLPSTGAIMSSIYDEKKDEDGFLYVTYSGEDTLSNIDGEGTPSNGEDTLSNIDGEHTLSGGEHTLSNVDGENTLSGGEHTLSNIDGEKESGCEHESEAA